MSGRFCQWVLLVPTLAGVAFGGSVPLAYLPAVGPVGLRFRPEPPPMTNVIKMPLPPAEVPEVVKPPAPAITNLPPVAVIPTNVTPQIVLPPTNSVPVEADPGFARPDPKVSPQMLMRYFNHSTNGTGTSVIAPMEFAPPPSPTTPPSTATYTTDPK